MKSSFHIFLEHLINLAYQQQRKRLTQAGFYGKVHPFASSYIRFGGWEINYNGKGWTRLFVEKVGKIEFVSKTIYLNVDHTYCLAGLKTNLFLNFSDLVISSLFTRRF